MKLWVATNVQDLIQFHQSTSILLKVNYLSGHHSGTSLYNIYYPSSPVKFFFNLGVLVLPPPPINKVMVQPLFVYAKKGIDTEGVLRDKNAN